MENETLSFETLSENVIVQLKQLNYKETSLDNYRRVYKRLQSFLTENNYTSYTPDLGKKFLEHLEINGKTLTSCACIIRRLDDFLTKKPYKSHHDEPHVDLTETFNGILLEIQ